MVKLPKFLHGDTIVEVTFAVSMFCVVAVVSIGIMNSGLSSTQASLEITMARNEIDEQAEALRFIHDSYIAQSNLEIENQQYADLWCKLVGSSGMVGEHNCMGDGMLTETKNISKYPLDHCGNFYDNHNENIFILNTRFLAPSNANLDSMQELFGTSTAKETYKRLTDHILVSGSGTINDYKSAFFPTSTYPRVVYSTFRSAEDNTDSSSLVTDNANNYKKISSAEGIWITVTQDEAISEGGVTPFFDFSIRTCWYAPGKNLPTNVATVVRLYNPNYRN